MEHTEAVKYRSNTCIEIRKKIRKRCSKLGWGVAANLNLLWRVVAKYTADSRSDTPAVTEHASGTQMNTISVKDIRRRILKAALVAPIYVG